MNPSAFPSRFTARGKLVQRMQDRLQAQSWPRVQMALIVAFTGLAGLLVSAVLLKLGVNSMALRYPVATLVAYGAFLDLLWLWMRTRSDDWADAANGLDAVGDAMPLGLSRGTQGPGGGGDVGSAADADELAVVVLALVAVAALALVGGYVVMQAPVLLAEVALDGAVAGSLYHRLHRAERQHWALSAWGYTRWPLLFLLVIMALVGWGLQQAAPGAETLGQALGWAVAPGGPR